jgi:hypothetical protein
MTISSGETAFSASGSAARQRSIAAARMSSGADVSTGLSVAGVTVSVETPDQITVAGTATDANGRFALPVPDPPPPLGYIVVVDTPRTHASVPLLDITQTVVIEIDAAFASPPVQMPRGPY